MAILSMLGAACMVAFVARVAIAVENTCKEYDEKQEMIEEAPSKKVA